MSKMIIYVLIASGALCAVMSAADLINGPDCGLVHVKTRTSLARIADGQEAEPGSWPWMVALSTPNESSFCGGSIINRQFVLTAAHCLYNPSSGERYDIIRIVAGEHSISIPEGHEQERKVTTSTTFQHPQFVFNPWNSQREHDIALLKLDRPLEFNARVGPVCLPESGEELQPGNLLSVTGWGRNSSLIPSDILQQVQVPIVDQEVCKLEDELRPYIICAGYKNKIFTGHCGGDSGGPLSLGRDGKWYEHGIVAYGSMCEDGGDYRKYIKTSAYIDWIVRIVSENCSPENSDSI